MTWRTAIRSSIVPVRRIRQPPPMTSSAAAGTVLRLVPGDESDAIVQVGDRMAGPSCTQIVRGKTWRDLSPAEISVLLACDACDLPVTEPVMALVIDDPALWISISELARRKGISQQSVSERISRLGDKIELRPGRGRDRRGAGRRPIAAFHIHPGCRRSTAHQGR